jgi:hypothetical protein
MCERNTGGERPHMGPEVIKELTGFVLAVTYPDFAKEGMVNPAIHDDRERFSQQLGEDNVMTSFFTETDGKIKLGIFLRHDTEV